MKTLFTLIALSVLSATAASAAEHRREIPEAAKAACVGKAAGDKVQFSGPKGQVEAVCRDLRGQMVAVPEGMKDRMKERMRDHMDGMKKQAQDACVGKAAGDKVTLETPRGAQSATCTARGDKLLAVPEKMQEHMEKMKEKMHERHEAMRETAKQACAGKAAGDKVTLETPRGALNAVCTEHDGSLFAKPEHMPGHLKDKMQKRRDAGAGIS